MKISRNPRFMPEMAKMRSNYRRKYDFRGFLEFGYELFILEFMEKFKQSRIFCDRTSKRSRRAPWNFYKISKFKKHRFRAINDQKTLKWETKGRFIWIYSFGYELFICDFWKCLRSLRFFSGVYHSRKWSTWMKESETNARKTARRAFFLKMTFGEFNSCELGVFRF